MRHTFAGEMDVRRAEIVLKNSKITEFYIFAIGAKYRKPLQNLLALIHRCFRVEILEN